MWRPVTGEGSLDHAGLQLLELPLIVLAHPFKQLTRSTRLLFVHLGNGEADVDQYPVPRPNTAFVDVQQTNVDGAPNARYIHLREPVLYVDNLHDLTWDGETHAPHSPSQNRWPPLDRGGPSSPLRCEPTKILYHRYGRAPTSCAPCGNSAYISWL